MNGYEKALKDYIKATNSHDFNNVLKHLSTNAVYFFSDKKCFTIDDIRSYFENSWKIIVNEKYEAKNIQWLITEEKVTVCLYDYTYKGRMNDQDIEGGGKATNIFTKEKNDWKLIYEHLSSEQ